MEEPPKPVVLQVQSHWAFIMVVEAEMQVLQDFQVQVAVVVQVHILKIHLVQP
jgi:hypothetical protein